MKYLYLPALLLIFAGTTHAQLKDPSFEEVISLASVGNPQISPDGTDIVYQVSQTDWENNRYDSEIWMIRDGGTPFQFTNNPDNSSYSPRWSPDGNWIAYITDRGNKSQLHIISASGGESRSLTETANGVSGFEWSPDGSSLLFIQSEDRKSEEEKRKDKYGGFAVEDREYGKNELWLLKFDPSVFTSIHMPVAVDSASNEELPVKLLKDTALSVAGFAWSPDGTRIGLNLQPDQNILSFMESDIYMYTLADSSLIKVVSNPGVDQFTDWSPDGKSILYTSSLKDTTDFFYTNPNLLAMDLATGETTALGAGFDEEYSSLKWTEQGIYAIAWQKTKRKLIRINDRNGKVTVLSAGPERVIQASFSADGKAIAFSAVNDHDLTEVYKAGPAMKEVQKLTGMSSQISGWATSRSEMISWESEDGTIIEGVLHKPADYDPDKKYPLLVVIHGGPTGISIPSPTPSYVYPIVQWLNKGALVLQPNYRGSAGYGEAFRSLNVRNLGVGDAWDVISGVEHLEAQGLIDGDKVGVMGWSQGGYISAYLATTSDKFQAISVGAGISNWMTYYVNTDIHPFTRQYLKATPWSDEEIYKKTSPMTFINNASTPTLIQHGEFDRRVPVPNAYELYQGLQDVGVETKLIIYKGFGHGINKPKERLAATWHNWQWFGKYIWGEEIEIPE